MSVDSKTACRMSKASYVAYFANLPGGLASCPFYKDVGFTAVPRSFTANLINAAIAGTTETEVVLAFRGTLPIDTDDWNDFVESLLDWLNDGDAHLVEVEYASGLAHQGFNHSFDLFWADVRSAVEAQHAAAKLPVIVTGHSKGGALATLAAMRLQTEMAITPDVYTYGSPRVGNTQFAKDYNSRILDSWRFENKDDLVPQLPPIVLLLDFLAKADVRLAGLSARDYHHVGLLEFLSWNGSIVEGSSLTLDAQRLTHLAELGVTGQVAQVALNHSLEKKYIPWLCGMA